MEAGKGTSAMVKLKASEKLIKSFEKWATKRVEHAKREWFKKNGYISSGDLPLT